MCLTAVFENARTLNILLMSEVKLVKRLDVTIGALTHFSLCAMVLNYRHLGKGLGGAMV